MIIRRCFKLGQSAVILLALAGSAYASAGDETVFHPPEGAIVPAGERIAFSRDSHLAFVLGKLPSTRSQLWSFRTDTGELVDVFDPPLDFLFPMSTIAIDGSGGRIAIFGFGLNHEGVVLVVDVDTDGRFASSQTLHLPPSNFGFSLIGLPQYEPFFVQDDLTVLQPFWELAAGKGDEFVSALFSFDVHSGIPLGSFDLRTVAQGEFANVAVDRSNNQVAVAINNLFDRNFVNDVIAVVQLEGRGGMTLKQVSHPEVGFLAGLIFDPTGQFLFGLVDSQFDRFSSNLVSIDVATGELVQNLRLDFQVTGLIPSLQEVQASNPRGILGVIGSKTVAFTHFTSDGHFEEPVKLKSDVKRDFLDSNFEFLPGGYVAIAADFRSDTVLFIDTESGVIVDGIPSVFSQPVNVAPDGRIAVIDFPSSTIHIFTPDLSPKILSIEVKTKKLTVHGQRILTNAIVEVDGVPAGAKLSSDQLTLKVEASLAKGKTAMIEIVNPDGSRSGRVPVTRR